jgi:hypothetical protein
VGGGGGGGRDSSFVSAAFMDDASVKSADSQDGFKEKLIARYGNTLQTGTKGTAIFLKCMVTGCALSRRDCRAGHLLAKQRLEMSHLFKFGDIFDVKNGMLWAEKIEAAYGKKQVCLIYDFIHNNLHFKVLDPAIMEETIVENVTFKQVNGKLIVIPSESLPFKRLIWAHSSEAMRHAVDMDWVNKDDVEMYETTLKIIGQHLGSLTNGNSKNSDEAIEIYKRSLNGANHPMQGINPALLRVEPRSNIKVAKNMSAEDAPIKKMCSVCQTLKGRNGFSQNQWKRPTQHLPHIFCVDCNPEKKSSKDDLTHKPDNSRPSF